MDRVKGKVALVTGGASGIGRASALRLAEEGAQVVVTDIQDDQGKDVVGAIKKAGGEAIFLHHDVASEDAWESVIAETKKRFGKLHVLVNNAGIAVVGLGHHDDAGRLAAADRDQSRRRVPGREALAAADA